jgi:hypothetical protein
MTTMCRECGANPPVIERLCVCCHRDRLTALRQQREAQEQARIAASHRGRPAWRPDPGNRNHGHGTDHLR